MLELSVHLHTTACPHFRAPGAKWPVCAKLIPPNDQSDAGTENIMPDNGYVKSLNGRMRDELLNESLFFGLDHARIAIAEWRHDFNTTRPHSSLGYQTPAAFAGNLTATGSDAALIGCFASAPVAQPAPNGVTEMADALIAAG